MAKEPLDLNLTGEMMLKFFGDKAEEQALPARACIWRLSLLNLIMGRPVGLMSQLKQKGMV